MDLHKDSKKFSATISHKVSLTQNICINNDSFAAICIRIIYRNCKVSIVIQNQKNYIK